MAIEDLFFAEGSDIYTGSGTDIDTPGTWTSLGCVRDVTPNTLTRNFRDVPPCLNDTDRSVSTKPGTLSLGSVSATIIFDADQWTDLEDKLAEGTIVPVATVLGDSTKAHQAEAYVESLGVPQLANDGEVQLAVTFRLRTRPTQVASSTITG